MPLVRIDAPAAADDALVALGEAVHGALIEAFAIPEDDRFQVLHGAGGGKVVYDAGYLGVTRDEGVAFVQVFLRRGRTDEQKRLFYRSLAQRAMTAGFEARNLVVVLTESGLGDWSFGEGAAQYLDDPPGGRSVR
jgi:hypothetical protein